MTLAALLCGQGSDHCPGGMAQGLAHAAGPRSNAANGIIESLSLSLSLTVAVAVVAKLTQACWCSI